MAQPHSHKTVLITGATDGVGRGVAQRLASQGHVVLLHGRSQERLDDVARSVRISERGGEVRTYLADLSSLPAVRRLAADLLEKEPRIDVLIANAGVGGGAGFDRQESEDGYELRFAVNYLSHFLLITNMLERLRASAPARVVLVSSLGQAPVDFGDVMMEKSYQWMSAYCRSKLAQIAFGLRLAKQLDPAEITVNSLHPGTSMPTKMTGFHRSGDTVAYGIDNVMRLAISPNLEGISGVFFDREVKSAPHPWAEDRRAQERLWGLSERLIAAKS